MMITYTANEVLRENQVYSQCQWRRLSLGIGTLQSLGGMVKDIKEFTLTKSKKHKSISTKKMTLTLYLQIHRGPGQEHDKFSMIGSAHIITVSKDRNCVGKFDLTDKFHGEAV